MAAPSKRALRSQPRTTRAKPPISYAEPPSDDESELENNEGGLVDQDGRIAQPSKRQRVSSGRSVAPQHAPVRAAPARRMRLESNSSKVVSRSPAKKHKSADGSSTARASKSIAEHSFPASSVIPSWQTLPYQILVSIFRYASYPIYDESTFQSTPSCRWLLNIARLCRAFTEPALTVLYTSPPLVPMDKAHRLVGLLKEDPTKLAFKYRQKIESLRIDVGQVAAYSLQGSGVLDLASLVKHLPRLLDLEFYHQKDMSPYRLLDDPIKWSYPEALFDALGYVEPDADPQRGDKDNFCRLRSWRWSSRLLGKNRSIQSLREIHSKPYFSNLRKIAFVNFQIPISRKDAADPMHEKRLAEALEVLPNLQHLIFESSTLVNRRLLPLLPTSLRNLEIINCWEVISSDFGEFLHTHGGELRCLTLNHNQSLSLSFLPLLSTACPHLEVLRMNLTFFDLHFTYRDSEPLFEQLLFPGEVPSWPSTLQTIELIQLRKWETEAAEMFFQSLIDSAPKLPNLRRLVIQAILSIGWRDRASFRDKWAGSLDRVFKRVSAPPNLHQHIVTKPLSRDFAVVLPSRNPSVKVDEGPISKTGTSPRVSAQQAPLDGNADSVQKSLEERADGGIETLHRKKSKSRSKSPVLRRSRLRTRHSEPGKYAESSDSDPESPENEVSMEKSAVRESRDEIRRRRIARELEILRQTAGKDGSELSHSPGFTSDVHDNDSDDEPLLSKKRRITDHNLTIQGMCEVVDIRVDNLRPRETQVTEADFLDSEPEGDSDWNGDDDGMDDGYAW